MTLRAHIGWFPAVLALCLGAACSDDSDTVLVDACRVVVDDCGVGDSVGACIDALGAQSDDCLSCITGAGCSYAATCRPDSAGCNLPRAYVPAE